MLMAVAGDCKFSAQMSIYMRGLKRFAGWSHYCNLDRIGD
jgi:hypothetical protein